MILAHADQVLLKNSSYWLAPIVEASLDHSQGMILLMAAL
jgi:hypothetical protein